MPTRWYLSPVALRTLDQGDSVEQVVCPKEHLYIDPARNKRYSRTSTFFMTSETEGWALSMIRGVDFGPIDADPECVNVFANLSNDDFSIDDPAPFLDRTLRDLAWPAARLGRLRNRMIARGVDTTGLTLDSTIRECLIRIGQKASARYRPDRDWVEGP
jgi:hypothetical protein